LINTDNEENVLAFLDENVDEIPGVVKTYILSGSISRQVQKTEKEETRE
jgi:hypothetical protein